MGPFKSSSCWKDTPIRWLETEWKLSGSWHISQMSVGLKGKDEWISYVSQRHFFLICGATNPTKTFITNWRFPSVDKLMDELLCVCFPTFTHLLLLTPAGSQCNAAAAAALAHTYWWQSNRLVLLNLFEPGWTGFKIREQTAASLGYFSFQRLKTSAAAAAQRLAVPSLCFGCRWKMH